MAPTLSPKLIRHSVEGMTYDPRLVLFEFVAGLVLRKKQARRLIEFYLKGL